MRSSVNLLDLDVADSIARFTSVDADGAVPDYSRYADLRAEAFQIARVVGLADGSAATAIVAGVSVWPSGMRIAGQTGITAGARIKTEAGQRHSQEAAAESFQGLPPRYGLRHTFRQLIESIAHNFSSSSSDSGPKYRMHEL